MRNKSFLKRYQREILVVLVGVFAAGLMWEIFPVFRKLEAWTGRYHSDRAWAVRHWVTTIFLGFGSAMTYYFWKDQ